MHKLLTLLILALPLAAAAQEAGTDKERLDALEQRLEKLETKPANASLSSFNPAIGMALDTVLRDYDDKATFDFRAAELNVEAAADPFVKVYGVFTGSSGGVDVEEAAAQTTSLPYSLTVRGGRFFAPFGRLPSWHDHELPMVYRPNSIFTYVGGESQGDGVDVNYLFPTPFYLEGYAGAFNKVGADNARADNGAGRPFDQFTYLGRLHTYGDATDSVGVDFGASEAWTPKRTIAAPDGAPFQEGNRFRALSGLDLTVRYQPAAGGLYHGVVWTTEALQNTEQLYDPATSLPLGRSRSYAGYSNVETKLGRVLRVGGFADLTELPSDQKKLVKTFAAYATFELTEFNRIRLEYSRTLANFTGAPAAALPGTDFGANDLFALHPGHMVALQWTCVIGYHVHGFRGRWGT
jgi:hypothetical protein